MSPEQMRYAHLTAQLGFITARANHDLQHYGEWRCDYTSWVSEVETELAAIESTHAPVVDAQEPETQDCLAEMFGPPLSPPASVDLSAVEAFESAVRAMFVRWDIPPAFADAVIAAYPGAAPTPARDCLGPCERCGGTGERKELVGSSKEGFSVEQRTCACSAIQGQSTTGGWQPIETAPKDGTDMLLLFADGRPMFGYWDDFGFILNWSGEAYDPRLLTHWLPVPPAPSDEEKP